MPKLTRQHFEPNAFKKMNVKLAAQLLSNTVASAIRTTIKVKPEIFGDLIDNAIPTAQFVQTFNDIFDSLNCRNFSSTSPFERPLKVNNNVFKLLEGNLPFLDKLQIISKNEKYFKFIMGLKTTINAHIILIKLLKEECGIDYLLTGRTNQDCIENFFSLLRGKGGFNYMPSSHEIGVHFANVVVRKILLHSPFQNCLSDEAENIDLDWQSFKSEYENSIKNQEELSNLSPPDEIIAAADFDVITNNAIMYFTGYCIFKKIDCLNCKSKLLKDGKEINVSETFLSEKNFFKVDGNFGSLTAPSEEFGQIARSLVKLFEKYYHSHCNSSKVIQFLTKKCITMLEQKYTYFLPDQNNACYAHIEKLIHFFLLVLMRKNCKWSISKNEFLKPTSKICNQSRRKLRILTS